MQRAEGGGRVLPDTRHALLTLGRGPPRVHLKGATQAKEVPVAVVRESFPAEPLTMGTGGSHSTRSESSPVVNALAIAI